MISLFTRKTNRSSLFSAVGNPEAVTKEIGNGVGRLAFHAVGARCRVPIGYATAYPYELNPITSLLEVESIVVAASQAACPLGYFLEPFGLIACGVAVASSVGSADIAAVRLDHYHLKITII